MILLVYSFCCVMIVGIDGYFEIELIWYLLIMFMVVFCVGVVWCYDDVDGVVGVVLDFDGGCVVVYFGVGCVGELLG